jgi:ABC-type glycerol-3-phosphate transport system substrate-binding protein
MKPTIVIASVSIGLLISGCVTQPAGNQQTKGKVPTTTVKPSAKTGETDRKILANTFPSDIKGINVVVTYNPGLKKSDYKAEHSSGVPLDDQYAKDRDLDKDQVHFPGSGKTLKDFMIPKEKIVTVVSTKYDMTVYDKTDYVFTDDTVFEIHTYATNAGVFINSDVKTIPNNLDKSGGKKYLHSKNANRNFNDTLFYAVLAFCEKHQIRTK